MEGLTALLPKVEETGSISGIKVSREAPSVSNQLFADDSLILMRANATNAEALREVLDSYCAASGQMVSVEILALMTHKCRGSIVVISISKSVEPNEEQKEMISGFQ